MSADLQTPAQSTPASTPKKRWSVLGVAGELLITLGVVILLFVVWQLWWTDQLAYRNFDAMRNELQQEWGIGSSDSGTVPKEVTTELGRPFGLMYVPAMGDRAWRVPIMEGTSLDWLQDGVGHHTSTALPGQLGNMAIAGHRTTYGAPFGDIDRMKPGDQIIIETKYGWYIYQTDKSVIINSWEGWVLDPVPGKPRNTKPTQALITIYACNPKFSAAQRFVWFGHLVDEYTRSTGTPPAIKDFRSQ